jgi:hypothetical protein
MIELDSEKRLVEFETLVSIIVSILRLTNSFVYTTEACVAPERVNTQGPELHLDVSG